MLEIGVTSRPKGKPGCNMNRDTSSFQHPVNHLQHIKEAIVKVYLKQVGDVC